MQTILFEVPAFHQPTLILTAIVISAVSLLACVFPARRAARIYTDGSAGGLSLGRAAGACGHSRYARAARSSSVMRHHPVQIPIDPVDIRARG